jgi:dinuclear metal center YbgI/SA1388 family protein
MKLAKTIKCLDKILNIDFAKQSDFKGLQIGDLNSQIKKVLVGLEITADLVEQAIKNKAELIIVHHPFLFKPTDKIVNDNYKIKLIYKLIQKNIAVYIAHSNIDICPDGINEHLAKKLNLKNFKKTDSISYCVEGELNDNFNLKTLAEYIKNKLNLSFVKIIGDKTKKIKNIALIAGDGDSKVLELSKKYDCVLTGDFYYHTAVDFIQEN